MTSTDKRICEHSLPKKKPKAGKLKPGRGKSN